MKLDWSNVVNPERAELVFEGRNKEYGGYVLRKNYQKRITRALLISLIGIVVAFSIPLISSLLSKIDFSKDTKMSESVTLEEPPPIDKATPPPPPVIPPPPVQQTIKFTPPKVVKDEEVVEPPPTQEEVKDIQVAAVTQEGSKDVIDIPDNPVVGDPDEGKVFTVVEEMPSFPGGEEKLFDYIRKNVKYPRVASENGITGRVYLTFVVDKEGKIRDVRVLRGIGGGCDEEAIRVVKSMPDWKPGRQNGRSVQVQYNLPINFNLQ